MPQHIQHNLVYILLIWTTLNTIIQVIFITHSFIVGRNELCLNNSTYNSTIEPKHNTQSQTHSNGGLGLGKGKMMTFQATDASSVVKWVSALPDTHLVSEGGNVLTILLDGDYFLSLQVTLNEICNNSNKTYTVQLMLDNQVVLQGRINTITNSTGVLSKVKELSAGNKLMVKIDPPTMCVNRSESVTHLSIIFMEKSKM